MSGIDVSSQASQLSAYPENENLSQRTEARKVENFDSGLSQRKNPSR